VTVSETPDRHRDGDDPALQFETVAHSFGSAPVLEDVSLSVPRGTLLGLVGPNGAGKTTALRIANGTLSPDAGRVLVDGDPVDQLSSAATARRVATVPQDTTISFDFSVRDVVAMGRHPHKPRFGADPDPGAVDRAMERTGVTDLAERSIGTVSGGERQRVLVARALAQDAPVMAFDEPTASLDVTHQVATLELVRSLVGDGHSAVAAIHDLDLAGRYCDHIAVLAGGKILAHGSPESVLTESVVGAAFDADAVVTENPVTGSPLVTALGERGPTGEREATGVNRTVESSAAGEYDVAETADDPHPPTGGE
jgi:iron complex transport system ATP-binding protein